MCRSATSSRPAIEEQINQELATIEALRDSDIKSVMLRAQGISPQGMEHLKALLDRIREIEGLSSHDEKTE